MKPEELLAQAYKRKQFLAENFPTHTATINLVVPWIPRGDKTRLGKTVGPYGEFLSVNCDGGAVVSFECDKVIKFLEANGVEYMHRKPTGDETAAAPAAATGAAAVQPKDGRA